jgi:hypothetical protein
MARAYEELYVELVREGRRSARERDATIRDRRWAPIRFESSEEPSQQPNAVFSPFWEAV